MTLIGTAHYVTYTMDGYRNQMIYTSDKFLVTRQTTAEHPRRPWKIRSDAEATYNQITLALHKAGWVKEGSVDVDYNSEDREALLGGMTPARLVRRADKALVA